MTKKTIIISAVVSVVALGTLIAGNYALDWVDKEIKLIKDSEFNKAQNHWINEADNMFEGKINALKNELVYQLKGCEGGKATEDDALIIFDTNKKASIGQWQFQIDTVIYYYKKLYGESITRKQAVLIALDEAKSAELAERVLFEEPKGYTNWAICSAKHDIQKQIALIKKMDK
jgi:hypothetical protein